LYCRYQQDGVIIMKTTYDMINYKGITISNIDATDIYQVKQVIDTLPEELREVVLIMHIGIYDRKIYYTTCLHENANQTLILI